MSKYHLKIIMLRINVLFVCELEVIMTFFFSLFTNNTRYCLKMKDLLYERMVPLV